MNPLALTFATLSDKVDKMRLFSPSKSCDELIDTYAGFLHVSSSIIRRLNPTGVELLPIKSMVYQIMDIRDWLSECSAVDDSFRILMALSGVQVQVPEGVRYGGEVKVAKSFYDSQQPIETKHREYKRTSTKTVLTGYKLVSIHVHMAGTVQLRHLFPAALFIDGSVVTIKTKLPAFHIASLVAKKTGKEVRIQKVMDQRK